MQSLNPKPYTLEIEGLLNPQPSTSQTQGRRGGVPGVCVVGLDGELVGHLDAEGRGLECLLGWRYEDHAWPPARGGH